MKLSSTVSDYSDEETDEKLRKDKRTLRKRVAFGAVGLTHATLVLP